MTHLPPQSPDETDSATSPWTQDSWIAWTALLLDSYQKWTGSVLIPRTNPDQDASKLFDAPFVVVSHGTEADPLLNFANRTALDLWEMTLDQFLGTPSRQTAEAVHRDERAELLRRTRESGYIDDYSGIRISATGKRFRIHQATVWNIVNSSGQQVGQAAAFSHWTLLTEPADHGQADPSVTGPEGAS